MRNVLITLSILIHLTSHSSCQNNMWFEEGTIFTYFYGGQWANGHRELTIDRDTIVDGETFKIFNQYSEIHNWGTVYQDYLHTAHIVQFKNDTVFYLDNNDKKNVLYNFKLNVGDTIQYQSESPYAIAYDCNYLNNYILDSVTVDFIAGKNRRIQNFTAFDSAYASVTNSLNSKPFQIVEGIGSINSHLFPQYNHVCYVDASTYGFCEFIEDEFTFHPSQYECNFITSNTTLKNEDLKIYPSITTNEFRIENGNNYKVEAYALTGQQLRINNTLETYTLNSSYKGIIILRITNNETIITKQLVKI